MKRETEKKMPNYVTTFNLTFHSDFGVGDAVAVAAQNANAWKQKKKTAYPSLRYFLIILILEYWTQPILLRS